MLILPKKMMIGVLLLLQLFKVSDSVLKGIIALRWSVLPDHSAPGIKRMETNTQVPEQQQHILVSSQNLFLASWVRVWAFCLPWGKWSMALLCVSGGLSPTEYSFMSDLLHNSVLKWTKRVLCVCICFFTSCLKFHHTNTYACIHELKPCRRGHYITKL